MFSIFSMVFEEFFLLSCLKILFNMFKYSGSIEEKNEEKIKKAAWKDK